MNRYYTPKYEESLTDIAVKFNIPVLELKLINALKNNYVTKGQTLKVNSKKLYIVKENETLETIGRKFGINLVKLRLMNNLYSNKVYCGQSIVINDPIIKYTVASGETIFDIAKKYNILVDEIIEYNGLSNNNVYAGQKLYIKVPELVKKPGSLLVLLNKYFSLSSDYVPENLQIPNVPFPFDYFHEKKLMRREGAISLERLFYSSKESGINLYALSGYRSYKRQKEIFESGVSEEGFAYTNEFSAKPGESEHQTGLAMDVTSPEINYALSQSFENTKEGEWIKSNAYKYGFILRYPKGKEHITGYMYEPWHLRYVGIKIAEEINQLGLTFEEYLGVK